MAKVKPKDQKPEGSNKFWRDGGYHETAWPKDQKPSERINQMMLTQMWRNDGLGTDVVSAIIDYLDELKAELDQRLKELEGKG